MRTVWDRFLKFLFQPESDRWLTTLRIGVGVEVILYAFSLTADWHYFFASTNEGLIGRQLGEAIVNLHSHFVPEVAWLVKAGVGLGLHEATVLTAAWVALLLAGVCLLIGFFSRLAAVLAWFIHLAVASSGSFFAYGVDNFMTIGLFYLMLSPLPDRFSIDARWREPLAGCSPLLGFWRRVLQVHLCFIYFFGGLTKCLGRGWWDGSNLWRALIRQPFDVFDPAWIARWQVLLPAAGIAICLIELGYPFFVWMKRSRKFWLICVCAMHLGVGVAMGMHLFALVMIILNVAAFGPGSLLQVEGADSPCEEVPLPAVVR
jgi:uncharacterized membrane protein YphA (DoxX/SURF4 family)